MITEIQLTPIKPINGLVGFASFVLYGAIYCSSVGIYTRLEGGYRLTYPTKQVMGRDMDIFHPISKELGLEIEQSVTAVLDDVMRSKNAGYGSPVAGHIRV